MEGAPADDSRGFWGLRIPAGREIALRDQLDSSEYVFTAHFTQVALGSDPRSGKHTVYLRNRRGKFAIGTLEDRCCTQFSIDLFDESTNDLFFSHTGSSSVYITGVWRSFPRELSKTHLWWQYLRPGPCRQSRV